MLHRVALVKTDVSEELSASFIRVTRIGELGTTLAVRRNTKLQKIVERHSFGNIVVITQDFPGGTENHHEPESG
jgi:hypothetical protein